MKIKKIKKRGQSLVLIRAYADLATSESENGILQQRITTLEANYEYIKMAHSAEIKRTTELKNMVLHYQGFVYRNVVRPKNAEGSTRT